MKYTSVLQRQWYVAGNLARECLVVYRTHGSLEALRFSRDVIEGFLDERFGPPRAPETNGLDKEFGTDTAENVKLRHLDIQSPNVKYAVYYKATDLPLLDEILSCLTRQPWRTNGLHRSTPLANPDMVPEFVEPGNGNPVVIQRGRRVATRGRLSVADPQGPTVSNYTFVDFGSGKGLVVLRAAGYPFKKVVGVEFARELHETACKNVDCYPNYLRRTPIELVHGDALEYPLPEGDLVLYFYQPFEAPLTARMIEKIRAAVKGREILVACVFSDSAHNTFRKLWDTAPFLQPVAGGKVWTIYRARR